MGVITHSPGGRWSQSAKKPPPLAQLFVRLEEMSNEADNLERGRQEIWRRQKLFIAFVFMFLPYGFLVMWPAEHFFGQIGMFISWVAFGIAAFKIGTWWWNAPCPQCGHPVMGPLSKSAVHCRKCIHCGIDLRPTEGLNHSISFKRLSYEPGKKENVEPTDGQVFSESAPSGSSEKPSS
jgi:hypothetical protein